MRLSISIVAIAVTLSIGIHAATLTPSQALSRALAESPEHTATLNSKIASLPEATAAAVEPIYTVTTDARPTVYVFAGDAGRGFLCVAADDAAPHALLGFSDTGAFVPSDMPPAMKTLLESYGRAIAAPSTAADTPSPTADGATLPDIDPILPTKWGQGDPYNILTPTINGAHTPAGCVAVALGQCMYAERWPERGVGKNSYRWSYGSESQTLALDFDTITFDWDLILPTYTASATAAERAEVAKLIYAVGVAFNMSYNPAGSGSNYMTASSALIEHFDYAESVCYYEREYFEYLDWRDMIYAELRRGRPVPYSGVSSIDAHAFVVDGYRSDDYFHINWGFYGNNDGYFLLSDLNLSPDRSGDLSLGYNMGQAIITGLTRSSRYEQPAIELRVTGDFQAVADRYARSSTADVEFRGTNGIFSMAYATAKVTLGAMLVSSSGDTSYVASSSPHTFAHFSATQTYSVPASQFPTSGTYEVTPAFRDSVGVWHDILVPLSNQRAISLKATSSTLVFGLSTDLPQLSVTSLEPASPIYIGSACSVKASLTNAGSEYFDEVWPLLMRNDSIIAHSQGIDVNVLEGESADYEWVGSFTTIGGKTLTPGTYTLVLADAENGQYHIIGGDTEVEVHAASQAPLIYNASAVAVDGTPGETTTESSPAAIYGTVVPMQFDLECTQGYFGQRVHAKVFPSGSDNATLTTAGQFVGLAEGDRRTVSADVDLSSLSPGQTYAVYPWGSTSGRLTETPAFIRVGTTAIDGVTAIEPLRVVRVWTIEGLPVAVGDDAIGSLAPGFYILETVSDSGAHRSIRFLKR